MHGQQNIKKMEIHVKIYNGVSNATKVYYVSITVLKQHVSILIESPSGPSKIQILT